MEGRFIVRLESRNSERFAQLARSIGSFFISLHAGREGTFHGHLGEPGDHGPRKVPIDPTARRGIEDHGHPMGQEPLSGEYQRAIKEVSLHFWRITSGDILVFLTRDSNSRLQQFSRFPFLCPVASR